MHKKIKNVTVVMVPADKVIQIDDKYLLSLEAELESLIPRETRVECINKLIEAKDLLKSFFEKVSKSEGPIDSIITELASELEFLGKYCGSRLALVAEAVIKAMAKAGSDFNVFLDYLKEVSKRMVSSGVGHEGGDQKD